METYLIRGKDHEGTEYTVECVEGSRKDAEHECQRLWAGKHECLAMWVEKEFDFD